MEDCLDSLLATLYAPGVGVAPPRQWPMVVRAIRRAGSSVPLAEALTSAGLGFERLLLAEELSAPPEDLLTAVSQPLGAIWPLVGRVARGLPASAVEVSLDAPALPPAIWAAGDLPASRLPTLAGIGCRVPSPEATAFARAVGRRCAEAGIALVSGGAEGCDSAFAEGHGGAIALLPHGLNRPRDLSGVAAQVSPFPRAAPFTRERAMRRNALVVAAADLTLVASARLREGGAWHAALGALRRRAPLAVYVGAGEGSGARALVALGALPVRDASEALAALALIRNLGPNDDPATQWAHARGTQGERLQPLLSF